MATSGDFYIAIDRVPYGDWQPPLTKDIFDLGRARSATIARRYVGSVGVMDLVSKGLISNRKSTLESELARMVKGSKTDDELEIGLWPCSST